MEHVITKDGFLDLEQHWLPRSQAQACFEVLHNGLAWQTETYTVFGKTVAAPRLVCWYGDEGAVYRYSGVEHVPIPFTAELLVLKNQIENLTGQEFNSVLGNLYRDGEDSMGWHSDKEKELGPEPFIASLSLGESRIFSIRHNQSKETLKLKLSSGCLLLMGGTLQSHWKHSVPKSKAVLGPRINLTFRKIIQPV